MSLDTYLWIAYLVPVAVLPPLAAYLAGRGNAWVKAELSDDPAAWLAILMLWPGVCVAFALWLPYRLAYYFGQRRRLPRATVYSAAPGSDIAPRCPPPSCNPRNPQPKPDPLTGQGTYARQRIDSSIRVPSNNLPPLADPPPRKNIP